MKVYFSSHFDSGHYLDHSETENQALFNVKIAGPQGLLGLLEQKTGHSGKHKSHAERKIEYAGYLKEYLSDHSDVFYAGAFDNDPSGVATELLRCRDQLVLAEWNKMPKNISERLDTLMAIEKRFDVSPGHEDRWVMMLDVLEKMSSNPGISELSLFDDEADLHPFYGKIIKRLRTLGVKISKGHPSDENAGNGNLGKLQKWLQNGDKVETGKLTLDPADKKSLQLFQFHTDMEAAHFFAAQVLSGHDCLVICEDGLAFDSVSSTFGKSRPGTGKTKANTTTLQLFKLSSSLFAQPFNILNYMAYLQCPLHPVSKSLRTKIMKQLSDTGGFNQEKINEIIDAHDFYPNKDEGVEKEKRNEKKRKGVRTALIPVHADKDKLPASEILAFYHTLEAWAAQRCKLDNFGEELDDNEKKQLMHVYKMAGLLGAVTRQTADDYVPAEFFMQSIRDIYEPVEVVQGHPEKGSPARISSPGQIISRPGVTVWLDFCNQEINPSWYDFLSDEEIVNLEESGMSIWRKADQAASSLGVFKKVIERTKNKLCLAIPLKAGDKPTADHPLYSLLKSVVTNLDEFKVPVSFPYSLASEYGWQQMDTNQVQRIALPVKKIEYQVQNGGLIPKRQKESFSSVERMIQDPFDWVIQYGLDIKPGNTYEMDEVETTLGNVAHAFIQDLFESESYDMEGIRKRLAKDYDSLIKQALVKYGAILLLDENRFEKERLISQLKESLLGLLDIINENKLEIKKSEFEITCNLSRVEALSGQEFNGSIDLLLQDEQGRAVVFDLKWAHNETKYMKKLREGKAMQLALYNELVKESGNIAGKNISGVKSGYYLLAQALLITGDDFAGKNVFNVDSGQHGHEDVIERISNSIVYRREQFSNGVIEEGDDERKENISYFRDAVNIQLIPLDLDTKNQKKKKNYYSKFKVFKGETAN